MSKNLRQANWSHSNLVPLYIWASACVALGCLASNCAQGLYVSCLLSFHMNIPSAFYCGLHCPRIQIPDLGGAE